MARRKRFYNGYYAFGGGLLDGRALENALGETDYPLQNIDYASSGGGVTIASENGLLIGVEGHAIVDQEVTPNYQADLGIGYGLLNLGWMFKTGGIRIIPLLGFGGSTIGLDVDSHPVQPQESPRAVQRLSWGNLQLHIGLAFEIRFGGWIGMTVGLQVGYFLALFSRRKGVGGPYFRVMFGGGARQ